MKISKRSVIRLSQYRDSLLRFKSYGVLWVVSDDLANSLGFTAAQVRKDFSAFRITGKKKLGYQVDSLITTIDTILGRRQIHKTILGGVTSLGIALLQEQTCVADNFQITAAFDFLPPAKAHAEIAIPLLPASELIKHVRENAVEYGIIAGEIQTAQRMLDLMALAGIRGILNLCPVDLKSPETCAVHSINWTREFESVVYFANRMPVTTG